ncbi:hypothetical protein QQS21_001460 [Conoideocrella luteorostrata]|uniref:Uncharacterized protein n=1 Tax=Conoideocrella luteorostrata TaxID=1105319 RepID=A0AAJ0FXH6_9HYPO|nr:hypothetical protein QQS21_001460 [Conoideocrella luteorostrata]
MTTPKSTPKNMAKYLMRQRIKNHPFDSCKPNNPNIPFFYMSEEYRRCLLADPPAGSHPDRSCVYLVEPGLFSIEIYEAIITKSLGCCPALQKYICECGVVQLCRSANPYVPASAAVDRRLREERDICFTLVSLSERIQIHNWMDAHGVKMIATPQMATPYGYMKVGMEVDVQIRQKACEELGLGFDDADYPRSALPPGVIPVINKSIYEWSLLSADGIARNGRATDDCGIKRIEWPIRRVV